LIAALQRDKLDALIAPTMSPAWPTDLVLGDHFAGISGYGIAAVAGTPSLTVPIGDSHGLPVGLAFMGAAYSEGDLISFGFALEKKLQARRPPQYRPALELK
jgi:amidase